MPNVMAALLNVGGALCWVLQFGSTPTSRVPCSNAAKMQNPLKFAGVPQARRQISATSRPKFTILWGHVEEILLLNKFFSDCRYVPWLRRYSPTELYDGTQMAIFWWFFLRPVFSVSHERHISDLRPKFTLRPHMCASMADILSATAEIRRGKKRR